MRISHQDLAQLKARITENARMPLGILPGTSTIRKYRNKPTVVDGITFDSKLEAKRYGELKLLQKAGQIGKLRRQTKWSLKTNDIHVTYYISDFDYLEQGILVVEDCKGHETSLYRLKAKMMFAQYGIKIQEIRS
jgi:Protein of unknown function (DUF1064)